MTHEELNCRVQGWVAHAAHGNTYRLRRSLLSTIPIPREAL